MTRKTLGSTSANGMPFNTAERQVIQTLRAAEDVAAEIERLRRGLRLQGVPPRRRAELQGSLFDALDRLTNLLGVLSGGSVVGGVSEAFRDALRDGVADLRQRVFATGVKVLENKLDAIWGEATAVLEGRSFYRMGLADRMRGNIRGMALTIEGLGGREELPSALRSLLESAESSIQRLRDMEEDSALLPSFG